MPNVILVGPSASGKTHIAHRIAGLDPPRETGPTTRIDFLTCEVQGRRITVWDTPACVEARLPDIAAPLLDDCNFVVICYDGRREWTPVCFIDGNIPSKCIVVVALTRINAFNLPFSIESFDFVDRFGNMVPIFMCNSSVRGITQYILSNS